MIIAHYVNKMKEQKKKTLFCAYSLLQSFLVDRKQIFIRGRIKIKTILGFLDIKFVAREKNYSDEYDNAVQNC